MADDDRIPECYYCSDDSGRCDQYPKLEEDRYFSTTLREDFEFQTVYNVCDIFLFKHASLSFCFDVYFFYNQLYSTSLAMQDLTFASFSKSMIGVRMTKKRSILRRYMV